MPHFVEVILVKLADETCKVTVFEVFRQDRLGELLILLPMCERGCSVNVGGYGDAYLQYHEAVAICAPPYH